MKWIKVWKKVGTEFIFFFRMKFIFLKFLLDNGNEFYSSFSIFFFGQFSPELSLQAEFQINLMPYLIYMSLKLLFHYSQFAQFCPFFFQLKNDWKINRIRTKKGFEFCTYVLYFLNLVHIFEKRRNEKNGWHRYFHNQLMSPEIHLDWLNVTYF